MAYIGWDQNFAAKEISKHPFCTLEDLQNFVIHNQHAEFYNEDMRSKIREQFQELMTKAAPFGERKRFPSNSLWVNLKHNTVVILTDQILNAIVIPCNSVKLFKEERRAFNQAFSHLSNIAFLHIHQQLLEGGDYIYNQAKFEKKLRLKWVAEQS